MVFSKQAVISPRDGVYCFMCRVGDLRKSHIILARVHMYVIKNRYTEEGEIIPCDIEELEISNSKDCLLFMPIIVEHKIDENSPLFYLLNINEPRGFIKENFEILVTLEGLLVYFI